MSERTELTEEERKELESEFAKALAALRDLYAKLLPFQRVKEAAERGPRHLKDMVDAQLREVKTGFAEATAELRSEIAQLEGAVAAIVERACSEGVVDRQSGVAYGIQYALRYSRKPVYQITDAKALYEFLSERESTHLVHLTARPDRLFVGWAESEVKAGREIPGVQRTPPHSKDHPQFSVSAKPVDLVDTDYEPVCPACGTKSFLNFVDCDTCYLTSKVQTIAPYLAESVITARDLAREMLDDSVTE